jgi:alpha-amylase
MGILLQGFYKLPPNDALPSPADGKPGVSWWWDHIAAQAKDFSLAGFSAIWLPPGLKTSSGASAGADGYGPFDDYDMGSKKQKGSVPTRYGTREQLQRCGAILRANGLDIYLDMVEHQRAGDGADHTPEAFVFRYLGANGTPTPDAFPKILRIFFLRYRAIQILEVRLQMICRLAGSWRLSTRSQRIMCSTA